MRIIRRGEIRRLANLGAGFLADLPPCSVRRGSDFTAMNCAHAAIAAIRERIVLRVGEIARRSPPKAEARLHTRQHREMACTSFSIAQAGFPRFSFKVNHTVNPAGEWHRRPKSIG
jgi:hypothetical protein